MRRSLTFGQAWGIPLKIHLNWFIIAALVTWSLAVGYFPQEHPGWQGSAYWMVGIFTSFLFFGSVLIHELGHALIALREGVRVNSITLFIFGGIAHIDHEPETAGSEFRIVAAGPLASLGLAVFFSLLGRAVNFSPEVSSAALYLSQINLILAAFNLLPGFPLDGGRILRSLFWKWKSDFEIATRWATSTGLGIAMLFIIGGFLLMISGNYFTGLWVAFIGWYLSTASRASYRQMVMDETEPDLPAEAEARSQQDLDPAWFVQPHQAVPASPKAASREAPVGVLGTTLPLPGLARSPVKVPFAPGLRQACQREAGLIVESKE